MKDSRIGESLWDEWCGEDYNFFSRDVSTFYTIGHIDLENDIVKRALASALQRDGVAVSLGEGYRLLDDVTPMLGYAGLVDGDNEMTICTQDGTTRDGDIVDEAFKVTWVEIQCQKV